MLTAVRSGEVRRACTRPYRVVVRRKNVSKMKGEHMLVEGIRIFWVGLQRTNNMRRYTASSPISKRYTYRGGPRNSDSMLSWTQT